MKNKEQEKFLLIKEAVLENLALIKRTLEECVEDGMLDPGEDLYNYITTLIEDAEAIAILPELEIVIFRGQDVEKQIDSWLATQGRVTIGLRWPDISVSP